MFDFEDDALDALGPVTPVNRYYGKEPVLICWYSSGFSHDEGAAMFNDLLKAAAKAGIGDSMILGFPEHYDILEGGYELWPKYVDRLIDEIDSVEEHRRRPLLLVAHSKGTCPAMSVATRLGDRVKKVYIAAAPLIKIGEPTPWEQTGAAFRGQGDKVLLKMLLGFQPDNIILSRTTALPDEEFAAAVAESKWLTNTVKIMRLQYTDGLFPDMTCDDPPIKVIEAPIMALSAEFEASAGSTVAVMAGYADMTTGGFTSVEVKGAAHMDVLSNEGFVDTIVKDVLTFLPTTSSDP